MAYFLILPIILLFLWRTRVEGAENVPLKGKVIFAPNHTSFADGFFLGSTIFRIRGEKVFFIVSERVRKGIPGFMDKGFGLLFKKAKSDPSVLPKAKRVLDKDCPLVVFFEGGVRDTKPKTGTYRLHLMSGAPIVPVWIDSFSSLSFWQGLTGFLKSLFLKRIKIVFGVPLKNLLDEGEEEAKTLLGRGEYSPVLYRLLRQGAEKLNREVQKLSGVS